MTHDAPLASHTTLGLGGAAERLVVAEDDATLRDALRWAQRYGVSAHILGGGSNVIVPDEGVQGLVVHVATRGRVVRRDGPRVEVKVAAGEPWDELVAWAVSEGLAGLECLAGIPGLVGATPIQNVGAYGQEVSETITLVDVLDRQTLATSTLSAAACDFGYRDSAFKRAGAIRAARYVVTHVTFALTLGGAPALRYAELTRAVDADASLVAVRDAVLALRRAKSMVLPPHAASGDPNLRSAGSFFTNPVVDDAQAADVAARAVRAGLISDAAAMPSWPVGAGRTKLAAGWLVERAGFAKGTRRGHVGLSTVHALALVHHGGGTTRALLELADEIVQGVEERFGVVLEREPRVLGVDG